ncbi:MAG: mannonate dehydratase [Candidatus Latescibacteria bacterium]|jgi:mannonate dehydratase|nr:mannonate dehydratase [Gemmatimonadaceae bacterium]MDP6019365.1 mannonate dehydratase [Candidatus Latescibacterota bacterium]MDP7447806.1 mannonate dehydratase [Candidatus Latescibacterota bacterium]HJP29176.1 mannonate dehydratase [Candidatus Latescibacterota bacterium]
MKLGLGFAMANVTDDNLRAAAQLGVTHAFVNHADVGDGHFEFDQLLRLRHRVEHLGLQLEGLENFPRPWWEDVLTAGPRRDEQIDGVCRSIDNMGRAGIHVLGYCFSILSVWGHWRAYDAGGGRGNAGLKSFDYSKVEQAPPHPAGPVSVDEMWERFHYFLERVIPVAESADVRLAAHQDDPPAESLRGIGRLLTSHDAMQKLLDLVPSHHNGLEFCQGTVAEMGPDRAVDAVRRFADQNKIVYVHFRNVRGAFPVFDEVFHDEGDVDMLEAMLAYKQAGFDGVMTPDHSPRVTGDAGMSLRGRGFALGYMRGLMQAAERFG